MQYFITGNRHITSDGIIYVLELHSSGTTTLAITDLTGSVSVADDEIFNKYLDPNTGLDLRSFCEDYGLDYDVVLMLFRGILEFDYFDTYKLQQ